MSAMASQFMTLMIVYSTFYSGTDERKHQSSTSLAFVQGIHRWLVNSPYKGPITWKMLPFDDVIMFEGTRDCHRWCCPYRRFSLCLSGMKQSECFFKPQWQLWIKASHQQNWWIFVRGSNWQHLLFNLMIHHAIGCALNLNYKNWDCYMTLNDIWIMIAYPDKILQF